ncbi:hypothetical protein [Bacteroides fluxus]|uniref:hypothetical protein n=1 Tax=Bacteroides fluxus TaxID=626930 RepID=UPI0023F4AD52|nr:hypothetical protein [Bacteroides fluxus]
MKEMTERQKSMEKYGVYFSKNATANEYVAKCERQIAKCIKWQKNLEELKAEKEKEVESFQEKTKELAERLNALSEDERDRFFEFYKHSVTTSKKQKE